MSKKALLMILDGWGLGDQKKDDVIFNTPTPYWDYLMNTYPHSQLQASGENVGLPDGQMGNSEVGHLNIGAGRVVYQDLVKINRACADGSILQNPEIVSAFSYAKENGKIARVFKGAFKVEGALISSINRNAEWALNTLARLEQTAERRHSVLEAMREQAAKTEPAKKQPASSHDKESR